MKKIVLLCASVVAFLSCGPGIRQEAHPKAVDNSPTHSASLSSQDRDFLERAAEGSMAEMTIGILVNGRALRSEVRAFGLRMVSDHSTIYNQLSRLAATKRISIPTSLGDHQQAYDEVVDRKLDDFDRKFMQVMIGDHQQAAELFKAEALNGTDPDLKAFAASTLPVIEAHLQHAISLGKIAQHEQPLTQPPTPESVQPPAGSPVKKGTIPAT